MSQQKRLGLLKEISLKQANGVQAHRRRRRPRGGETERKPDKEEKRLHSKPGEFCQRPVEEKAGNESARRGEVMTSTTSEKVLKDRLEKQTHSPREGLPSI